MKLEDINNLPVKDIADKNCILFLWTTPPLFPESLETIKSWGFNYKTFGFVWVKLNKKQNTPFTGLGYWSRANTEVCLLATKGKVKRLGKGVKQLIVTNEENVELEEMPDKVIENLPFITCSRIEGHSKKPDIVRDRITELVGDQPKIELFAREKIPGWDALGYDVDGIDIRDSIEKKL